MIFNKKKLKKEQKKELSMSRSKGIYVLYKGEKQISGEATLDVLAKQFNVKIRSLLFYQSPTYAKRGKKNRRALVRVE